MCKFCNAAEPRHNGLCKQCHSDITKYKRYISSTLSIEQKVFIYAFDAKVERNKRLGRYVPKFLSATAQEKLCITCGLIFDTVTNANICEACNKRERSLIALHKRGKVTKAVEKHIAYYDSIVGKNGHVPRIYHTIKGGM